MTNPTKAALSQDETITLLATKAREAGDDFIVKVFRKRSTGIVQVPELIASVGEATLNHIVSPETWLPALCGGGPMFQLAVYHSSEPSNAVGGFIHLHIPTDGMPPKQPGEIDTSIIRRSNWTGPRKILYPEPAAAKPAETSPFYSIMPSSPPTGTGAANSVLGGGASGAPPSNPPAGPSATELFLREQLEMMKAQVAEAKHRAEMDRVKQESDAKMAALESRLAMLAERKPEPAPKGPDVTGLIQAVTPLLQAFMSTQAENQRRAEERHREATQQTQEMVKAMMTRPPVDPVVLALLEKSRESNAPQATLMHSMAEAQAMMSKTMLEFIQTATEMTRVDDEEPAYLKALKEVMKGMGAMAAASAQSQRMMAPPPMGPPRQLPSNAPPQPRPAPPPQGFNGHAPNGHPPPVTASPVPVARPAPTPSAVPPAPPAVMTPPETDASVIDQIQGAIMAHYDVEKVANAFVEAVKADEPSVIAALEEADGSIEQLFVARLGFWVMGNPENEAYVKKLAEVLMRVAREQGLIEEEGEDPAEEAAEAEA